ncbi:unnamed protein product [Rhizophagus irregularis]|nr:unnamed protein product [Rhizophagus irregularis]
MQNNEPIIRVFAKLVSVNILNKILMIRFGGNDIKSTPINICINKDKVETCLGKDIRDVINDICHIIRIWQKKVLIEYNRKFKNEHKYLYCKFAHLFYDVKVNTSNGDNRIKERLIK